MPVHVLGNPRLWTANLIIVSNHQRVGEFLRVTLARLDSSTSAWSLSWSILSFEQVADFHFHRNAPFCGRGLHLGSNYTNRPELTLIHCRVCSSDLPTGTYSTLGVFRFDIFHPASSHYQSIQSQTSLSPFLATKEDKRSHLTDCKLLPHLLNCMSTLRFMLLREPRIQQCHREKTEDVTETKHAKPTVDHAGKSQSTKICYEVTTPVVPRTVPGNPPPPPRSMDVTVNTIHDKFSPQPGD